MITKRLTLDEVRDALGDEATGLSDAELIALRDHAFEFAEVFISRADRADRAEAESEQAAMTAAMTESTPLTASLD